VNGSSLFCCECILSRLWPLCMEMYLNALSLMNKVQSTFISASDELWSECMYVLYYFVQYLVVVMNECMAI
jgi:hypothetical protein